MLRSSTQIVENILSNLPEYYISETVCHPFNSEDLEKRATCIITKPDINVQDGVNDSRLGVVGKNIKCDTCHQKILDCPGHIGIIKLEVPFINPRFIKHVISILKSICHGCGELLLSQKAIEDIKITDHTRLFMIAETSSKMICTVNSKSKGFKPCKRNPSFSMTDNKNSHLLTCEYKFEKEVYKIIFPIEKVITLLKSISNREDQLKMLGFTGKTKPIDYVIQNFFIIPPCSRTPMFQNGELKEDHITSAYKVLVSLNEKLKDKSLQGSDRLETERDCWNHATHIMDNTDCAVKHGKSEPIKGCKERLVNKDGLARSSQWRRTNYTARTVVGPSSGMYSEYLEVPSTFREHHTTKVFVGPWNINKVLDWYESNCIKSIIYGSGPKKNRKFIIDVSNKDKISPPAIGDTVERWSIDGDYVLMCRQPTLTKYSNMALRIKHTEKKIIGVGCPPTQSYNMDFDGDEGNMSKSQTIGARVEAAEVMSCEQSIMAFKNSYANIGILYNGVSSAYLLSVDKDLKVFGQEIFDRIKAEDEDDMKSEFPFNKRKQTHEQRCIKNGIDPNSSKGLFSITFPPDFYYKRSDVLIKDGVFVKGILTKKDVSTTSNGIISYLHNKYSKRLTMNWITEANRFLEHYIAKRGFSLGYRHIVRSDLQQINNAIEHKRQIVQEMIDDLYIKLPEGEFRDMKVTNLINELTSFADGIVNGDIDKSNPLYIMSASGAKGNEHNTAQISSCLGQQFIKGRLPEQIITNGKRCLPFFKPDSKNMKARGFVQSSFIGGLRPSELMFHFMASRLGLIDTAIKTADTGSISHRFIRVLEDYSLDYDGTVSGANDNIISINYGDGFCHERLIQVKCPKRSDKLYDFMDVDNTLECLNQKYKVKLEQ